MKGKLVVTVELDESGKVQSCLAVEVEQMNAAVFGAMYAAAALVVTNAIAGTLCQMIDAGMAEAAEQFYAGANAGPDDLEMTTRLREGEPKE